MDDHRLPDPEEFAFRLTTDSPAATEKLGERVAQLLRGGEILLLHGDLGAGKTCFTRGLCRGLETDLAAVSPTFTLVNTYCGRLKVMHLDFYRIDADADLEDIGVSGILDALWDGDAVAVVEWPERIMPALGDLARIELLVLPGDDDDARHWYLRGRPSLDPAWSAVWNVETDDPTC